MLGDIGAGRLCADLEDGPFTYRWVKILGEIISLEMVQVKHRRHQCKQCQGSGMVH